MADIEGRISKALHKFYSAKEHDPTFERKMYQHLHQHDELWGGQRGDCLFYCFFYHLYLTYLWIWRIYFHYMNMESCQSLHQLQIIKAYLKANGTKNDKYPSSCLMILDSILSVQLHKVNNYNLPWSVVAVKIHSCKFEFNTKATLNVNVLLMNSLTHITYSDSQNIYL